MKLYYSKGACSLTVRILAHELGIACEFEAVDLKTKQTASGKDFFTINPKGAVPAVILDNNELLTENTVILQYLADQYKATQFLPAIGSMQRYHVLEWLNFVSTELHKNCSPLFNPNISVDIKKTIFLPILKAKLVVLEKQLSKSAYLSGDQFTLETVQK
jgi:glutathione S-transferase